MDRADNIIVVCKDCGLPYGGDDWIDTVLPPEQWLLIAPENGILCANCIVKRASKLYPYVVKCEMNLVFKSDICKEHREARQLAALTSWLENIRGTYS